MPVYLSQRVLNFSPGFQGMHYNAYSVYFLVSWKLLLNVSKPRINDASQCQSANQQCKEEKAYILASVFNSRGSTSATQICYFPEMKSDRFGTQLSEKNDLCFTMLAQHDEAANQSQSKSLH